MTAKKQKRELKKAGRPTVMTDEVIRKIEEVAALDGSVAEMALYAGIHPDTIYAHMAQNKDFSDRIASLRERPVLAARQRVVKGVQESYANAIDYLARKRKNEFSHRTDITSGGEPIKGNVITLTRFDGTEGQS